MPLPGEPGGLPNLPLYAPLRLCRPGDAPPPAPSLTASLPLIGGGLVRLQVQSLCNRNIKNDEKDHGTRREKKAHRRGNWMPIEGGISRSARERQRPVHRMDE